jgi:drug/metabolite transporter (DMT)-like permease
MSAEAAVGRQPLKAAVAVGVFTLLWAVIESIGGAAAVPAEQVVWTRYGTHLLALALIAGRQLGLGLIRTPRPLLQIGRSLLMLGMPLSYIAGTALVGPAETWAIFSIAPLVVLAMTGPHRGLLWTSTTLTCFGAVTILHPGSDALTIGGLAPLTMVACFVAYLVLTERLSEEPVARNLWHSAFAVFILLTVRMPFVWRSPTARGWVVLISIGLLGLATLYALDLAVRFGGVGAFGATLSLLPLFELAMQGAFSTFRVANWIAVVVVVAAIGVALWLERRHHQLSGVSVTRMRRAALE